MNNDKKKILIVDDDKGTREFYRDLFENAGYSVSALSNPEAAYSSSVLFAPDLLVLDWEMPFGGGKKAYESVTAALGHQLPVIFASGFPEKITYRPGAKVAVLGKPPDIDVLLQEAERLLAAN